MPGFDSRCRHRFVAGGQSRAEDKATFENLRTYENSSFASRRAAVHPSADGPPQASNSRRHCSIRDCVCRHALSRSWPERRRVIHRFISCLSNSRSRHRAEPLCKTEQRILISAVNFTSSEASVSTPPTPPINSGRDYLREHLDELAREVAQLREMVARQRKRIGDRHPNERSLSPAQRPTSAR